MFSVLEGRVGAFLNVLVFIGVAVANAFVSTGVGVAVTNAEVARSHPVYVLPIGAAFSIWGIIYFLEAVYIIYQALPSKWEDEPLMKSRPWMIFAQLFSIAWLYLFGYSQLWVALIVIILYEVCLVKTLFILDCNLTYLSKSWSLKLCVYSGIAINAGWVFVASLLQMNINFMAEGWAPSQEFAVGCVMLATAFASYMVYIRADAFYAFASAWALSWVIANQNSQNPDDTAARVWGTAADVCSQACLDHMQVCRGPPEETTVVAPRQGLFYSACSEFIKGEQENFVLIASSTMVINACYAGVVIVLISLVAGVIAGCCSPKTEEKESAELDEVSAAA